MRTCRSAALCLSILASCGLLAACTTAGDHRTDSSAGAVDTARTTTAADSASSRVLRNVAGKWNMVARPTSGRDSTPTRLALNATGDTTGWTMVLGGQTVPLHVRVNGDTIVATSEPYSSVRRTGITVRTTSSHHLEGDRLVGTTVAHYVVQGADSLRVFATEATRAP